MIPEVPNPVQSKPNFERRRSFAVGAQKEGFRSGTKESYFNQNVISLRPGADIQQAIDTVYNIGGGKVVLLSGTHERTSDINVLPNVVVEGETSETTVDFMNTDSGFIIAGTPHSYTGTIAVTNGSKTVTGTTTSFDGDLIGLGVFIDGSWNYVGSVESATSLTLESDYSGPTQSGLTLVVADVNNYSTVRKLIITNSNTAGIDASYCYSPLLFEIYIYNSTIGINCNYVEFCFIDNMNVFDSGIGCVFTETYSCSVRTFLIANTTGDGIQWTNAGDSTLLDFGIVGCSGNGLTLTNCDALTCVSFTVADNTGHGIELISTSDDNQFTGGKVNRNGGDGMKLTATSDRNGIYGVTCDTNTGYGINIAAASCDNNMVSSTALTSNIAGQLNNAGTGSKGRGIIGAADFG